MGDFLSFFPVSTAYMIEEDITSEEMLGYCSIYLLHVY